MRLHILLVLLEMTKLDVSLEKLEERLKRPEDDNEGPADGAGDD